MANIIDYLTQYGQDSFSERSFNQIDILILNELAYLPLAEKLDLGKGKLLVDLAQSVLDLPADFLVTPERLELLKTVVNSQRFADLTLLSYVNEIDPAYDKQFAALVFALPSMGYRQLVFRGTDDSLVGWKEDFNMTYMSEIPAQRRAVAFLTQVLTQESGQLLVSGHSKGGNLAVYASSFVAEDLQEHIQAIHVFDAPGLHERVLTSSGYQRIRSKMVVIRPQDSIVGVMLTSDNPAIIIASDKQGIEQHNVIHWQVDGYGLKQVDSPTQTSQILEQTFKSWTSELGSQDLKLLVDVVFDIFADAGINSLNDIQANTPKKIAEVLSVLSHLPSDKRDLINQSFNLFIKQFSQYRYQQISQNVQQTLSQISTKFNFREESKVGHPVDEDRTDL